MLVQFVACGHIENLSPGLADGRLRRRCGFESIDQLPEQEATRIFTLGNVRAEASFRQSQQFDPAE